MLCSALDSCQSVAALSEPFLALETQLIFQTSSKTFRCNHPLQAMKLQLHHGAYLGLKENIVPYDLSDPKLRWLFETAESVKTICLIRDPRDIWASVQRVMIKSLGSNIEKLPDQHLQVDPAWLETIKYFLSWVRDSQRFFVRYEDLTQNPNAELHRISREIGFHAPETFDQDILPAAVGIGDEKARVGGKIFTQSIGNFRRRLSESQISFLNDSLRSELTHFGYDI